MTWIEADVRDHEFGRRYDLWHDRALFHFMVDSVDRRAYLATLERGLAPGGHVVIATFGPEGPRRCSGLPVHRYDVEALRAALGDRFKLCSTRRHRHLTPAGAAHEFVYAHLVG